MSDTGYHGGGNRQINKTLHIMTTVQLRNATEGGAYHDRKKAGGKSSMEAMRCLKRRLSDTVYRTMLTDLAKHAATRTVTGPGGHRGNDSESSATGSQPQPRLFGPATPGPVTAQPKPTLPRCLDTEASHVSACDNHPDLEPAARQPLPPAP
jgi:transposase